MSIEKQLFNINESAEYCGLSRTTFLRYVKDGLIPSGFKMGPRAIRWHREDLDEYIQRCRASSAA